MKRITILGNNSGRNAGDNAILGNLLHDFSLLGNDIVFQIPTINPWFIRDNFGQYQIKALGMMPWNLAIRNLGWPLYKAMTDTDLVLITDNILFDRKLNNPLVNYLKSIAFFSYFSRKKRIPIILYNASVGPVNSQKGAEALQKVLNSGPLIITRDNQTRKLIEDLNLKHAEIVVHADSALNTGLLSQPKIQEIIQKEGLFLNPKGTIGLNVNAYIGNWGKKGALSSNEFCRIIADTADSLIHQLGVDILFTVTQIMDFNITNQCIRQMKNRNRVKVIGNNKYNYQELAALLGKVGAHAGLRTHSLIFCAAVGTPMISINAYPKSKAFLETIGMGKWNIDIEDLTENNLFNLIQSVWNNREQLRNEMEPIVELEKKKARQSAGLVLQLLDESGNH